MNSPAAGALTIELVSADESVCSVAIRSGRPAGLGKLFAGRAAAEAPILSRRLFALCAHAQGAASELALAAARGEPLAPERLRDLAIAVLAERVFETLRACIVGWPWGATAAPLAAAAEALRVAAAGARALAAGADDAAGALCRLEDACHALGVPERPGDDPPPPATAFGALHRQCAALRGFAALRPDPLGAADDPAVTQAWAQAPEAFAARPALKGRMPEAGAGARHADAAPPGAEGLSGRLAARLIDIRLSLAGLRHALATGEPGDAAGFASARTEAGPAYGALESARGRLYHFIDLEQMERVRTYGIVAPTEWNFHGSGPFVARLLGARIGRGETARLAVARLAALFDPCVAYDILIREAAHA